MQQREELDAIFGKRPEPQPVDNEEPERLEVYITTNKVDTFKCVTIGLDHARQVEPLIIAQVRVAIAHYLSRADTPRD